MDALEPGRKRDYEKLGRAMEEVLVKDYGILHSTGRQAWSAFVRGMFFALGALAGTTLVLGVVAWLFQALGGVPLVGHYLQEIGQAIGQAIKQTK